MTDHVTGFDKVAAKSARIVILGSMPGVASLEQQAYYAHPRNAFWPVMQSLFGIPVAASYEERLQSLTDHHIALWDVAHRCQRKGSLDSDIKLDSVQVNDFKALFSEYKDIRAVFFNGGKSAELFRRLVLKPEPGAFTGIELMTLPSTSPANARYTLQQKVDQWRQIMDYLD